MRDIRAALLRLAAEIDQIADPEQPFWEAGEVSGLVQAHADALTRYLFRYEKRGRGLPRWLCCYLPPIRAELEGIALANLADEEVQRRVRTLAEEIEVLAEDVYNDSG